MAKMGVDESVFDESSERLWPDPHSGPFRIRMYWVRRNGTPRLVGAQLLPLNRQVADHVTLTTVTWRDVKLAEIASELREGLEYVPPSTPPAGVVAARMRPATARRLRRVAEVYQGAWQSGNPPTQAVARVLNVTPGAAGNLVKRAREAGFLPPTQAGIPQA